MRTRIFCGFAMLILMRGVSAAAEHRPSPRFEGKSILAPPEQESPWTPPETELPEVFVTATETLFRQTLADPRGCEYREIEVGTGSCWSGDAGVVKTHGWVLPVKRRVRGRFAVCWNGLVYPAVSVGDKADLRADVLATVKADEDMRAKQARDRPDWPFYRHRNAVSEPGSVSHSTLSPLMACFLLRLEEGELAANVWAAWTAGMRENTNDDSVHIRDPYLMLATEWIWSLFDRAVCAHMRGDDLLALLSARALVPIQKAVETEAQKRGFERRGSGRKKHPYLRFLGALPSLLADQERRANEPKREQQLPLGELPKAERIAARIEMLDEVAARQWSQPGGVSLGESPIVQALIEEGDDAVEPLLKCLEEDTRLTRSVHFHRDFHTHRTVMGVHEAAYVTLAGILKTSFFGAGSTGDNLTSRGMQGRKAVATAEEIDAFTLDLNDWFEITKPGSYRLKFVFTKDSGLGEGETKEVAFSLAAAREKTR